LNRNNTPKNQPLRTTADRVAGGEVALQERPLLIGRPGLAGVDFEVTVTFQQLLLCRGRLELRRDDPD
jgi:hypothetical protein